MIRQAAPAGLPDLLDLATDPGEVTALAPEWRALAERRGSAFLTPEWFLAWLRHCGRDWEPHVAVARTPGGIVRGILPLVSAKRNGGPELRVCPIGDRFHPVAAVSDEEAVAAEAAHALAPGGGLRSLLLENVDADGEWWRALAKASPAPLATVERGEATLPFVELAGIGWDEYLAGRSRQLRSQLGRKLRSLRREHEVRFRRTLRLEDVPADLLTLFRLHDARWAERPQSSAFADPDVRAFHFEFATAAFERGWLRLFVMEVDGAPVAALYGWSIGGRWSYYQAGFDPAWSRYSPGFLLLGETIRAAIAEGASEYDLLRGDEAFKRRFATSARTTRTVLLAPRGHQAHINAAAVVRLRRAWRTLPSRPRAQARRLASRLGVRLTT
ncbi:MAG TPA: GNAT family N-acetyltransferase [Solirubrobacterales bacterium]|jgi:CelD/BcsL family acetyltransferase involved in cellulose biosynthesis